MISMEELNFRKKDFARTILEKFQPNYNYELLIIDFPECGCPILSFDEKITPFYNQPGVYGIHCFATNRTFITGSSSVLSAMAKDYYELENDFFESPAELQKEFNKSPSIFFIFIFFTAGPEWKDFRIRSEEKDRIRNMWPYDLYYYDDERGANLYKNRSSL